MAEQKSRNISFFVDSFSGAKPRFLTNANVTVSEQSREIGRFELGVLFSAILLFFVYLSLKRRFLSTSPYRTTIAPPPLRKPASTATWKPALTHTPAPATVKGQ
jgi:hypothetical protein